MTGVGDMSDPADERYLARCPACHGTGAATHWAGGLCAGECDVCDGCGLSRVSGDTVVTTECRMCEGSGEHWPVGEAVWAFRGPYVCTACNGDGEVTGPADEVCA